MFFCFLPPGSERYGLKGTKHSPSTFLSFLLAIALAFSLIPNRSFAQGFPSWWGSSSWFDWSDFRFEMGARLFLPKLHSAKIVGVAKFPDNFLRRAPGQELDLIDDVGITEDPSPFKEIFFVGRVDRIGLRYHKEDEQIFSGSERLGFDAGHYRLAQSELDVRATRVGMDIDCIRYPLLRLGINFDIQWEPVQFKRIYWDRFGETFNDPSGILAVGPAQIARYEGAGPWTIGLHATAIPARVRDVPVTIQGRFRYPMPLIEKLSFLSGGNQAKITDLEASVGMRPSVWDLSLYGYSTFAIGVEAGYRWQRFEIDKNTVDVKVKATWSGGFLQLTVVY